MDSLGVRSGKGRRILRALGYESIFFVLVMLQLPVIGQEGAEFLSFLALSPAMVGLASITLLTCQPEVSRRETWLAWGLVCMFIFILLFPVLGKD